MEPYQQRIIDEANELLTKIENLTSFMLSEAYPALRAIDQGLLMVQIRAMRLYHETLRDRIARF